MPSTLAVSGGASAAVVGMYLVRSVLERIGKGAVEADDNPQTCAHARRILRRHSVSCVLNLRPPALTGVASTCRTRQGNGDSAECGHPQGWARGEMVTCVLPVLPASPFLSTSLWGVSVPWTVVVGCGNVCRGSCPTTLTPHTVYRFSST